MTTTTRDWTKAAFDELLDAAEDAGAREEIRRRIQLRDQAHRSMKLAGTYLQKTVALMRAGAEPYPWRQELLFGLVLEVANVLADIIDDEPFVDYGTMDDGTPFWNYHITWLKAAEELVTRIKLRRGRVGVVAKVKALENTHGRTPKEAAAFRQKAAELRVRHGL